ncbi:hypothetical protein FDT66_07175 [Polaribacter aestuariivivens]|uniref:Uncharacterized protein n=1 Tax=Polaribacter aestuariivivens TaxID=2304626 RepID=A0A5S3N599_9FLAO|nr:hypothetical protein [Polaribacter aestuariivivens]TMM30538.1 hypothetical protein FDT66_07175 [Polaribacter aestuariivivens]
MRSFIIISIFFLGTSIYCQSPDWSVNTSSYQHSMTFTIFLNVNGKTLTNSNDKVGAFVNDQPRGEANVVYNANAEKYVAYLSVLSNSSGETITFKIYDSEANTIVNTSQTEIFQINENVGGVFQSYSVAEPALKKDAVISSFSFLNIDTSNTTISDDIIDVKVPTSTDLTNLTPVFETVNNGKVFYQKAQKISGNATINFSSDVVLEVLSEDESVLKSYIVKVVKQNATSNPVITLSAISSTVNTMPIEITLTAENEISGLQKGDFVLENCFIYQIITTDNINFKLNTVATAQGNFSIHLPENMAVDVNNNGNLASNNLVVSFDDEAPKLIEISRQNPTEELNKASQIVFRVTFSEKVKEVSQEDFTTIANATVTVNQETESEYLVTVSNINNITGVVSLQLSETNNITDLFNNSLEFTKYQTYEK